ncbi:bifunctional DNA primase/polymerase [Streptomyces sp. NPDC006465]|uniref:bifunctional DNA primase/polymerase n=1 Tax=Streptomyces sp. NPDC006465 TaxID=3157174 RepID=UPI0033AF9E4D
MTAQQQGFHIFPCNEAGTRCPQSGDVIDKQPHLLTPSKPYKIRWGEEATNDLNRVIEVWSWSPAANIGVACKPSGLLVRRRGGRLFGRSRRSTGRRACASRC